MWRLAARSGLGRQLLGVCDAQRPLPCCQCFHASAYQMDSSAQQQQRQESASDQPAAGAPAASLSQAELKKFAKLSAEWWNPHGAFRPLHAMNPVRCSFIRSALCQCFGTRLSCSLDRLDPAPLKGLKLLDVGCGGGLLSEPLARMGASVTGIEPEQDNLQAAVLHAENDMELAERLDYQAVTAERLASTGQQFDAVCALEVVEHVSQPEAFAATLAALVKPGGALLMSTINRTPRAYAMAVVGAERIMQLLPVGTHDWTKFVTPGELDMLLEPHSMQLQQLAGMVYQPMSGRWELQEDPSVNYIAYFRKPPVESESVPDAKLSFDHT